MDTQTAKDRNAFASAQKLAPGDYTGPVYWRGGPKSVGGFVGEGHYESVADLLDTCARRSVEPPPYAWACDKEIPSSSASSIIEAALEEHYDGADENITAEHHAKLDEFLRRWWADSGVGTWRPDYTRAVVLR
jgi:hypothetical protein